MDVLGGVAWNINLQRLCGRSIRSSSITFWELSTGGHILLGNEYCIGGGVATTIVFVSLTNNPYDCSNQSSSILFSASALLAHCAVSSVITSLHSLAQGIILEYNTSLPISFWRSCQWFQIPRRRGLARRSTTRGRMLREGPGAQLWFNLWMIL